jgi:GAF domain-containing protein
LPNHVLATELETRKFRLLALTLAAAGLYLRAGSIPLWPAVALILGYFFYVMLLGSVILPQVKTPNFVYAMMVIDAGTLGAALYLTGVQSTLFILLPLLIIYYAIFQGYRTSIFAAIAFSLMYTAVTYNREARTAGNIISLQVPLFFLVALISGYLAQRRLEERREKEELQELIRVESRARSLLEMSQSLGTAWEPNAVLNEIAASLPRLAGLPGWAVCLREDGKLKVKNSSLPQENFASWEGGDRLSLQALSSGAPLAVSRLQEGDDPPPWTRKAGVRSLLILPLQARGETLGLAYLFSTLEEKEFSPDLLGLVLSYGEMAANALASTRLHHSTEAKIKQLTGELGDAVSHLERLREARRRPEIVIGELRIDGLKEKALLGGKPLSLSPIEFELLYTLAENVGQPTNQETLLRRVWGRDFTGGSNVVDVSIHRLRKKLGDDERILTVRGRGYMLVSK